MSARRTWSEREAVVVNAPVAAAVMPVFNDELAASLVELDVVGDPTARVAVRTMMVAKIVALAEADNWRDDTFYGPDAADDGPERLAHLISFASDVSRMIGATPPRLEPGEFRAFLEQGMGLHCAAHLLFVLTAFDEAIRALEPDKDLDAQAEAAKTLLMVLAKHARIQYELETEARARPWIDLLMHTLGFQGESAEEYETRRSHQH